MGRSTLGSSVGAASAEHGQECGRGGVITQSRSDVLEMCREVFYVSEPDKTRKFWHDAHPLHANASILVASLDFHGTLFA